MGNINDLMSSNSQTGTGISNISEIKNDQIPNNPIPNKNISTQKRFIADLSQLPKEEIEGVKILENIEEEVFKPGGDFDQALQSKINEFNEVVELIDIHNASIAASKGEEVPPNDLIQNVNMGVVLSGTEFETPYYKFDPKKVTGEVTFIQAQEKNDKSAEYQKNNIDENKVNLADLMKDEEEYIDPLEKELMEEEEGVYNMDTERLSSSEKDLIMEMQAKAYDENNGAVAPNKNGELIIASVVSPVETDPKNSGDQQEIVIGNINITPNQCENASPVVTETASLEETKQSDREKKIIPVAEEEKRETDPVSEVKSDLNINFDIEEEDFSEVDNIKESEQDEKNKEELNYKEFQASISAKIKPVSEKLNLSAFRIVNQPISISSAALGLNDVNTKVASWVLMNSQLHIGMKSFTGKELTKLAGEDDGNNKFVNMKNRYRLFYDKLTDPKPDSLETWLKSISYLDNDDLYFSAFIANFSGANYVPYDCPHCRYTFLSENIPIDKMYKLKDDTKVKEKFDKIRTSMKSSISPGLYVSEVVQITDKIAIAFRDPSIYSIIMENSLLDEKFAEKYSSVISIIAYIDNIYVINKSDETLSPVNYKVDVNNDVNTIKSKIITYAKIIQQLSPDQHYTLLAYLTAINEKINDITYMKPSATCPKCKKEIEESEITAEQLVFTRAQLAVLGLTSIN